MRFYKRCRRVAFLLPVMSILIAGCSGEDSAVWALNYATISNSEDMIEGVHVWTFFDEGWDLTSDSYLCAVVQIAEGSGDNSSGTCPGASYSFNWTLTTISSDCPSYLSNDPFLTDGITGGCIGDIPELLMDETPHEGETEGWYLLDEFNDVIPHGYVYPEALDLGETVIEEPWSAGEPHTLSPAWAWAL